jgi:hypothetical protein
MQIKSMNQVEVFQVEVAGMVPPTVAPYALYVPQGKQAVTDHNPALN